MKSVDSLTLLSTIYNSSYFNNLAFLPHYYNVFVFYFEGLGPEVVCFTSAALTPVVDHQTQNNGPCRGDPTGERRVRSPGGGASSS